MINKKFVQQLRKDFDAHGSERRQIISAANAVLHDSKKAIFSLHRDDIAGAEKTLKELEEILKNLEKKFNSSRLMQEGSYKAALEEYVEAKMLLLVMTGKKVDKIQGIKIDYESYLGGICDLTGELVRQAVNMAASGKREKAIKMKIFIDEIMAELVEFDMTGYLRTKYDQAKGNARKIEQINYEINLRK